MVNKIHTSITYHRSKKILFFTAQHLLFICLILLLCGFFWQKPSWEKINISIDKKYPTVQNISTSELKKQLDQSPEILIIDVREREEYAVSHLQTAVNIINPERVAVDKNTPIVVYCSVGVRSAIFANSLNDRGFTNVKNLRGSVFEWANKGYPLYSEDVKVKEVHPYNKKWEELVLPNLRLYSRE